MALQRYKDIYQDPEIHLFGKCSVCAELVSVKIEDDELTLVGDRCARCGAILDLEEVKPSVYEHFVITQAVSTANSFWAGDYALIIFAIQIIIRLLMDFPLWFKISTGLIWLSVLLGIITWFIKHGMWNSNDEEYLDAKKKMRWSFLLWGTANLMNNPDASVEVSLGCSARRTIIDP